MDLYKCNLGLVVLAKPHRQICTKHRHACETSGSLQRIERMFDDVEDDQDRRDSQKEVSRGVVLSRLKKCVYRTFSQHTSQGNDSTCKKNIQVLAVSFFSFFFFFFGVKSGPDVAVCVLFGPEEPKPTLLLPQ